LQDAIVRLGCRDEGDTAICLAIIGMLGCSEGVKFGRAEYGKEDTRRGAGQAQRLLHIYDDLVAARKAEKAGNPASASDDDDRPVLADLDDDDDLDDDAGTGESASAPDPNDVERPWYYGEMPASTIWTWLRGKTRDERLQIFATLVADRTGFFVGWGDGVQPYHGAFDVAVAQHVGLDMVAIWQPDEKWLASSRKPRLEVLARGIGLDPLPKSTTQLRAAIAERFAEAEKPGGTPLPPAAEWVPPEMRVLDKATFDQAFGCTANAVRQHREAA
jgi:hypothetical protein